MFLLCYLCVGEYGIVKLETSVSSSRIKLEYKTRPAHLMNQIAKGYLLAMAGSLTRVQKYLIGCNCKNWEAAKKMIRHTTHLMVVCVHWLCRMEWYRAELSKIGGILIHPTFSLQCILPQDFTWNWYDACRDGQWLGLNSWKHVFFVTSTDLSHASQKIGHFGVLP